MAELEYQKFPEKHYSILRLNRPDRLNALNRSLIRQLAEALEDFSSDVEMRVAILTGTGRAFSSGMDLKERAEMDAKVADIEARYQRREMSAEQRELERKAVLAPLPRSGPLSFSSCSKPFIAAINGFCLAGGMELGMDCDIRIAATEATFGLFEVKRGLIAPSAVQHLARVMPFGETMYLLVTGDTMKAEDAYRVGFVHEVVTPERLLPRAIEIADMISANAPLAVQASKAMAQFWRNFGMGESSRMLQWVQRVNSSTEDAKEGPRAFAEGRPPVWKGW
jgi:enoyl-CoA hydratase/carnithine racemase